MTNDSDIASTDVLVIGGGPAGLMAAIAAAGAGRNVLVLEQLDRPGEKLLATGGGRCNLTNQAAPDDFIVAFGRHGRFMQDALNLMDSHGLRDFMASIGVPTHCPDGVQVYPTSNSAITVQKALLRRAGELGVTVRTRARATALCVEAGRVTGVETTAGPIQAGAVVLATGGRSYPKLGGTGGGYELARQAGHEVRDPRPALVGLVTRETWPRKLAGVAVPARVWIDLPRQGRSGVAGDVLFTHRGLSGPAVLNISGDVVQLLQTNPAVPLRLDLSGRPAQAWLDSFDIWQRQSGGRTIRSLLDIRLPASVVAMVEELAGVRPTMTAAHLSATHRTKLAQMLSALPLTVTGSEGFDAAIVTRGGVALKQVDPRTLASRLASGLYFAGEVLDLDGPCGGYNLQWAFSSGHLAGKSAAAAR